MVTGCYGLTQAAIADLGWGGGNDLALSNSSNPPGGCVLPVVVDVQKPACMHFSGLIPDGSLLPRANHMGKLVISAKDDTGYKALWQRVPTLVVGVGADEADAPPHRPGAFIFQNSPDTAATLTIFKQLSLIIDIIFNVSTG